MNKYPIRVLKRKINSITNTPLVVDNTAGSIKVPKTQLGVAKFWKPLAIAALIAAVAVVGTEIVKPVVETSLNNKQYSKLAKGSSNRNKAENLQLAQVTYSTDAKGRRVATAPATGNDLKKTLDYLKTLPDVEEVTADKGQIKVTFFAAD